MSAPGPIRRATPGTTEPAVARYALIAIALLFLALFLVLPLVVIFYEALAKGFKAYLEVLRSPELGTAVRTTLICVGIAVPLNVVFGLAAAWCITKFRFPGRSVLVTLIELPFSVSPVIAGLALVLIFGAEGWGGSWFVDHAPVIFSMPGMVLATVFITFPFVARELIPLMEAQGTEEEQAARVLGAGGWQTFFRVTLPNVKWALLYGVLLCTARALGEFGAVAVVAGGQVGQATLPLYVEQLYHERTNPQPALAAASLLAFTGIITLLAKTWLGRERGKVEKLTPDGDPARAP